MANPVTVADKIAPAFERSVAEARAAEGPKWLRDLRLNAWKTYEETPFPTQTLEEWRYTNISKFSLDAVEPLEPTSGEVPEEARALLEDKKAAGRVLVVGGRVVDVELDEELSEKGVILADLETAAEEHSELVEEHLATRAVPATDGKFAALNAALWTAGVFLYVPRGVRVEDPIRVARWLDEPGAAVFPRTLIIADEASHVALVDEFASPDLPEPALSCGAVEAYANGGADVQYVAIQRWGKGVRHISMQRTIAGRDANLDTLLVNLGASVARVDLSALLEGEGSHSDMLGLYFGSEDQHFDHNTRQDHLVPNTTSDLLYKGALYDASLAIFRGIIRVHEDAQKTDAYQTSRNLLLSPEAESVSLPNLEIEADDVRCSHGATVGQLDQEQLFYLMSRGLSREQAERLVIFGFYGEVLDRLPIPDVVEELREAISAQIG